MKRRFAGRITGAFGAAVGLSGAPRYRAPVLATARTASHPYNPLRGRERLP
jgi:hypothetical protein